MYVAAFLDLTEKGTVPAPEGVPEHEARHQRVQIFPAPGVDVLDLDADEALAQALTATRRCRLISRGHCFKFEFLPTLNPSLVPETEFYLPATGGDLVRRTPATA